ncbi:MAG: alpha/beta hydrolase family protein [Candidatus Babeliales bacterium]
MYKTTLLKNSKIVYYVIILIIFVVYITRTNRRYTMSKSVSFKNSKNLTLKGTLWPASSDAMVIMAHGSGSNKLARGLFPEIAQALAHECYNVLSFDFSGHGESDDAVFTLQQSVDDVASALAYAKKLGCKKFALIGHSIGVYSCLKNYSSGVKTIIGIGGLTGPVQWQWESMCSPEQLEGLHKTGYIAAEVNDGLREVLTIDGNLLKDIQAINQEKLFRGAQCPVLLIHGDAESDSQELDLLAISQQGVPFLYEGSQLKIIPGANHTFVEVSDQVIKLIKDWFKENFPLS